MTRPDQRAAMPCGIESRVERLVEQRPDPLGRRALLLEDPLRHLHRLLIAGARRHAPQRLVGSDLEVLDGVGEGDQFGWRVGLRGEERAPVEGAEPERRVLEPRRRATAVLEACRDEPALLLGLRVVLGVGGFELAGARELGAFVEQGQRLAFDRVNIGEVFVELLAHIVGPEVAQRGVDGAVEQPAQPVAHHALLKLDLARDGDGVEVAGALGHLAEQVVRGLLHVLVGERVDDELSGCVGLRSRERSESLPGQSAGEVLDRRALRAAGLEPLADQSPVLGGLVEMVRERLGDLTVPGELGRGTHLGERLRLDRVDVGQVLGQLFIEILGGHRGSSRLI